jgi:hypothetical protein
MRSSVQRTSSQVDRSDLRLEKFKQIIRLVTNEASELLLSHSSEPRYDYSYSLDELIDEFLELLLLGIRGKPAWRESPLVMPSEPGPNFKAVHDDVKSSFFSVNCCKGYCVDHHSTRGPAS